MGLLRGLRAWGAVEEHARWLHRIKNLIVLGQPVGFGLSDLTLVHLQHDDPGRLQAAACSVRWINSLTMPLLPAHILRYIQDHCASPDISGHVVAYIYLITKITDIIPLSLLLSLIITILLISKNEQQMRYLNSNVNWKLEYKYDIPNVKLSLKWVFLVFPAITLVIFAGFYLVFQTESLLSINFREEFCITSILWIVLLYPFGLCNTIYRLGRLLSGSDINIGESNP